MTRRVLLHDPPDRFTAGAVGAGSQRRYLLQAVSADTVHNVTVTAPQLRLLAERMQEVLDRTRAEEGMSGIPAGSTREEVQGQALRPRSDSEFVVAALGLGWNQTTKRLVVEAHAFTDPGGVVPALEGNDPHGPDTLRVRLTGSQARLFVDHTLGLLRSEVVRIIFQRQVG